MFMGAFIVSNVIKILGVRFEVIDSTSLRPIIMPLVPFLVYSICTSSLPPEKEQEKGTIPLNAVNS